MDQARLQVDDRKLLQAEAVFSGFWMKIGVSKDFIEFLDAICALLSGQQSTEKLTDEFQAAIKPLKEQISRQQIQIQDLQAQVDELRSLTNQLRRRVSTSFFYINPAAPVTNF